MAFCALLFAPLLAFCSQTVAVPGNNPKGLHYIGVGYNLLEGNPEGGAVSNGGVDPGLLFTRKVFKLTWDTNKVSMDGSTSLPDQVSFAPRQSCVKTNSKEVVTGSKSYQKKLNLDVSSSGKSLSVNADLVVEGESFLAFTRSYLGNILRHFGNRTFKPRSSYPREMGPPGMPLTSFASFLCTYRH